MARRPGLVIFDCDGVLVDSETLTVEVEARVLTEMGWPTTPAEVVERFMGRSSEAMLADIAARIGAERAAAFDEVTAAEIGDAFATRLVAVDGVVDLVEALHGHEVPTCVASSGSHTKMRLTLGVTGLWPRFEGRIFSASEVARGKPAPDLFLHAADRCGIDPTDCVVIEDSVPGVLAAVAGGMTVYGFGGGLTPPASLAAAGAVVFERMADLTGLLGVG